LRWIAFITSSIEIYRRKIILSTIFEFAKKGKVFFYETDNNNNAHFQKFKIGASVLLYVLTD
jgi:hypothetical protein